MMVNEAYGKCMKLPQDEGSDSESATSIPDDSGHNEEQVTQKKTATGMVSSLVNKKQQFLSNSELKFTMNTYYIVYTLSLIHI